MKLLVDAKKTTASATSFATPLRFMGVLAANRWVAGWPLSSSNSIHPGATQLTATSGAKDFAIASVSMWSAAFDAQ